MSRSTNAILTNGTTIEQIKTLMEQRYDNVSVVNQNTFSNLYYGEGQAMYINFNNIAAQEYGVDGVWVSMKKSAQSIETAKYLCERLGGYVEEDDCGGGIYPLNYDLFILGKHYSKEDELKSKIISLVGSEKLRQIMKIFEEYKNI